MSEVTDRHPTLHYGVHNIFVLCLLMNVCISLTSLNPTS